MLIRAIFPLLSAIFARRGICAKPLDRGDGRRLGHGASLRRSRRPNTRAIYTSALSILAVSLLSLSSGPLSPVFPGLDAQMLFSVVILDLFRRDNPPYRAFLLFPACLSPREAILSQA